MSTEKKSFGEWVLLFGVALLTLVIDQITKWLVIESLGLYETWVPFSFLEGIFDITYTRNTGAAFGLGQEFSNIFLVIAVTVAGVIIYYYRQLPTEYWPLKVALGFMMGGAIGNAFDRITRGYVVDFFHLHGWPIFNIADSMIVVGVGIWVVVVWWEDRKTKNAPHLEERVLEQE